VPQTTTLLHALIQKVLKLNKTWESSHDELNILVDRSLECYKILLNKPCFDEESSELVAFRKKARIQKLEIDNHSDGDRYVSLKCKLTELCG
jgi:hypothetical protein